MRCYCIRAFAVVLLIFAIQPFAAWADSWMLPETEIYRSSDGNVRFTVTPRELNSQLDYYSDRIEGREPAGVRGEDANATPRGRLERRGANGRWQTIWDAPLVNEVAPVQALVTNSGDHVVTFDNWASVGYGDDVVVIYDPDGALVQSYDLDDLLPAEYVMALPRSVSSIWWGRDHALSDDETRVVLKVVRPGNDILAGNGPPVNIEIDLADGNVLPYTDPHWDEAITDAQPITAELLASLREQARWFAAPLTPPDIESEWPWHRYLAEAYLRLDPQWAEGVPHIQTFLSDDESVSVDEISDERQLLQNDEAANRAYVYGSPVEDAFTAAMVTLAHGIAPGSLEGVRLYVAVSNPENDRRIAAAFAPTGAEYHRIDPASPIQQRSERLSLETARTLTLGDDELIRELARRISDGPE